VHSGASTKFSMVRALHTCGTCVSDDLTNALLPLGCGPTAELERLTRTANKSEVKMKRACPPLLALAFAAACHQNPVDSGLQVNRVQPRPAVIPADGGEKRFL